MLPGHAVVSSAHGRGAAHPVGQEEGLWRPLWLSLGPLATPHSPPRSTVGNMHLAQVVSSVSESFQSFIILLLSLLYDENTFFWKKL